MKWLQTLTLSLLWRHFWCCLEWHSQLQVKSADITEKIKNFLCNTLSVPIEKIFKKISAVSLQQSLYPIDWMKQFQTLTLNLLWRHFNCCLEWDSQLQVKWAGRIEKIKNYLAMSLSVQLEMIKKFSAVSLKQSLYPVDRAKPLQHCEGSCQQMFDKPFRRSPCSSSCAFKLTNENPRSGSSLKSHHRAHP